MQDAIAAAYDQDKLKSIVNTRNAEKIRAEIKKLAIDNDSEGLVAKDILKLITQMKTDDVELTEDETQFMKAFEGSDFQDVKGDAADMMNALLKKFS